MNKSTKTAKTNKKRSAKKVKKKTLWRRLWSFLFKVFLVFAAVAIIYGIYLDQQIKERIDGNVWELPAAVYEIGRASYRERV